MEFFKNFINKTDDNENKSSEDSKYYKKYMTYKKKYLELKKKIENSQSGGSIGKLDIVISGQTSPKNIFQKAFIKYHDGRYLISIHLPILNMGPLSFPIELQDGKVYQFVNINNNEVIRFKYKDDTTIRTIDFKVNSFLRKRISVNRGNSVVTFL